MGGHALTYWVYYMRGGQVYFHARTDDATKADRFVADLAERGYAAWHQTIQHQKAWH